VTKKLVKRAPEHFETVLLHEGLQKEVDSIPFSLAGVVDFDLQLLLREELMRLD
jgi:hypothetical protein